VLNENKQKPLEKRLFKGFLYKIIVLIRFRLGGLLKIAKPYKFIKNLALLVVDRLFRQSEVYKKEA
jgi:hypothetical protein